MMSQPPSLATPRWLVAAPRSGAGKTTITLGIVAALRRRGLAVRTAKSGPDYIDPAFHAAASGAPGTNLDSWAMPPPLLDALFARTCDGADLLVVESAMGLFDGVAGPPAAAAAPPTSPPATAWPSFWCWTSPAKLRPPPPSPTASPPSIRRCMSAAWS